MNDRLLILLCFFLAFISCTDDVLKTSVKVDLSMLKEKELEVYNIEEEILEYLNGTVDSFLLVIDEEVILDLDYGWSHSYIHVRPGDQLQLGEVELSTFGIGLLGEISKENKYLEEFRLIHVKQMEEFFGNADSIIRLPIDSYKAAMFDKNQPLKNLIVTIKSDDELSEYFKNAMQRRLDAAITNDLSYYKGYYQGINEEYPEIPDDYYELFSSTDISDPAYLIFEDGRQVLNFYSSKDLLFEDYDSDTEFYRAELKMVEPVFGKTLVSDYCNYDLLWKIINYGSIDDSDDLVAQFRNSVNNKYLLRKLDKTLEPWSELVSGKPAPNFKATTRDGRRVELNELKGKKVYVDVWATWCGPCLYQIPYLKEIEEEMHDENIEFVSVSIDEEKDRDKWKDYVEKEQLTGIQLMADGAWKSDIASSYNIKGIPRFLLIDEEGKIISSNALKPSNSKLKDILLN